MEHIRSRSTRSRGIAGIKLTFNGIRLTFNGIRLMTLKHFGGELSHLRFMMKASTVFFFKNPLLLFVVLVLLVEVDTA